VSGFERLSERKSKVGKEYVDLLDGEDEEDKFQVIPEDQEEKEAIEGQ